MSDPTNCIPVGQVEAWVRWHRDEFASEYATADDPRIRAAIDRMLDDLREHRATGTPLNMKVAGRMDGMEGQRWPS